ncbi:hypothetical protein MTR67_013622 [Solanum verrucosum]|uniref:Uncharacterized protein n=1 Tax=Solanum verrucosum TaxID=315347 RepID=A0AAF0QC86_SOLVR|nr:hypothetical protein MTR67_013622 [Solanum verrucosum]
MDSRSILQVRGT